MTDSPHASSIYIQHGNLPAHVVRRGTSVGRRASGLGHRY
jgi:hypothetical protein